MCHAHVKPATEKKTSGISFVLDMRDKRQKKEVNILAQYARKNSTKVNGQTLRIMCTNTWTLQLLEKPDEQFMYNVTLLE